MHSAILFVLNQILLKNLLLLISKSSLYGIIEHKFYIDTFRNSNFRLKSGYFIINSVFHM